MIVFLKALEGVMVGSVNLSQPSLTWREGLRGLSTLVGLWGLVLVALIDVGRPTLDVDGTFWNLPRSKDTEAGQLCSFTLAVEFIYSAAATVDPFTEIRTSFFCLPLWTEDSLPGILSAFAARLEVPG